MKSKILFYIAVGLAFLTVSCDSYLDKEPDDMQTIEGVFAKRSTTEQYLANAYAYLPEQYDAVCIVPPMYGLPAMRRNGVLFGCMLLCRTVLCRPPILLLTSGLLFIAESGKPMYSSNMWENVKNWKMANWKPGLPKPDISM